MQTTAVSNTPSAKKSTFTEDLANAMAKGNASYRIGLLNYLVAYKANVVDTFANATKKNNEFIQDMTNLDALIAQCVKKGDKPENVEVDFAKIREEIVRLQNKYNPWDPKTGLPNERTTLFTPTETGENGRQQALDWAKAFGLPESSVKEIPSKDGGPTSYFVSLNTGPLDRYDSLYQQTTKQNIPVGQYDILQKASSSQFDIIKNDNQLLISEFSRRLQQYNNICTNQASTNESNVNAYKAYIW